MLVLSHVLMGTMAAALLPIVWPQGLPNWHAWAGPLARTAGFYLLGQAGLMISLRYAEPSRVSPMLAFKLVVLAAFTVFIAQKPIAPLQWIAIGCCVTGAVLLNYVGGTSGRATLAIAATCLAYSISDWSIAAMVRVAMAGSNVPLWQAATWGALACYALCGLVAAALLPAYGSPHAQDWIDAMPFAASWLIAMLLLYGCFALVGVVYGNILQSLRGIISVGLGMLVSKRGLFHFEQQAGPGVLARRLTAAALMTLSVILYRIGEPAAAKPAVLPANHIGAPASEMAKRGSERVRVNPASAHGGRSSYRHSRHPCRHCRRLANESQRRGSGGVLACLTLLGLRPRRLRWRFDDQLGGEPAFFQLNMLPEDLGELFNFRALGNQVPLQHIETGIDGVVFLNGRLKQRLAALNPFMNCRIHGDRRGLTLQWLRAHEFNSNLQSRSRKKLISQRPIIRFPA